MRSLLSRAMLGARPPNPDRLADEGTLFTGAYSQSAICTLSGGSRWQ